MNDQNLDRILSLTDKKAVIAFLEDIVHPEAYGHAVSAEVRSKAYMLLILLGERNGNS